MKKMQSWIINPVLFFLVAMVLFLRPIQDMDEIWNYNFGYNVCNGLIPYTQFNCIVTPLSVFISSLFLSVFGNTMIVFRALGAVLIAAVFSLLFIILKLCTQSKVLALAFSAFGLALCFPVWIYNYNNLNLLLILLAIFLELKAEQADYRFSVKIQALAGFVYGLLPISKQSVGALLLIYNAAVCIYSVIRCPQKKKVFYLRLGCACIPLAVFVIYLLAAGSFGDFLDYCVWGIGTFSHKITYLEFLKSSLPSFLMGIFPILVTVQSVYTLVKGRSQISRRFHLSALAVSWIGMSVAYPLCDYSHMCIAIVPFAVCLVCCFKPVKLTHVEKAICLVMVLLVLGSGVIGTAQEAKNCKKCTLKNFSGLLINPKMEESVQQVEKYIYATEAEGYEVLIADSYAAVYLLPLDKYYKDFSLLNMGNLGTQTVDELLFRDHAIYLLRKDPASRNWQSHFQLLEYIQTNYIKVGEVNGFEAYKAP